MRKPALRRLLYHQRNVVAYPQDPDAALSALGMSPADLCRTLQVQFVGENRDSLRQHPDLQVSVVRLRAAFQWLSQNSWPFMDATRHHSLWETGALDDSLEGLLRDYERSVGADFGGVPAELIQGASRIASDHAHTLASGPADCTPADDSIGTEADDPQEEIRVTDDCAGIIDGGVDDVTPIQLWDFILKNTRSRSCVLRSWTAHVPLIS